MESGQSNLLAADYDLVVRYREPKITQALEYSVGSANFRLAVELDSGQDVMMRTCTGCKRKKNGSDFRLKSNGSPYTRCVPCQGPQFHGSCTECEGRTSAGFALCLLCARKLKRVPDGTIREGRRGGYSVVKVADHPRANRGWIDHHVYVMEQHLGRYLYPGENVHHKNGVRNDNEIKNLELWCIVQPAGQRVEDLVIWAQEILDRYGDR